MAGILAASVSVPTHATSANNDVSGYVTNEQITLSTTPTGSSYSWGLSRPSGSAVGRAVLSSTTVASPTFTPDVGGEFLITCTVDSTTVYTLRASVTQVAASTSAEAFRLLAKTNASVPAPSANAAAIFLSDTLGKLLAQKSSAGVVHLAAGRGVLGAALTDADATIQIGDGVRRALPNGTLTANRIITLGTTSASVGHVIDIERLDATAFTLAVVNGGGGGGTLLTMPVSVRMVATFRFDGTNWALEERRQLV